MTNWLPNLAEGSGPIYVRLADHIESAIEDGVLAPAQNCRRNEISPSTWVTIGTISRAYSLIHERGLVSGEVGRGTYVNDRKPAEATQKALESPFGGTRVSLARAHDRLQWHRSAG